MTVTQRITIPLSKTKMIRLVLLGCILLAVGYWFLGLPAVEIESQRRFNSPLLVHGIGLASIAFGAIGIAPWLRKLFVTSPGFVLDNLGLTDDSSPLAAGFIPWSEIKGFRVFETERQKILYVVLKDPKKYIAAFKPMRRMVLRATEKLGGSPVFITASSLAVEFSQLVSMVNDGLIAYRQSAPNHSFEADGFAAAQLQR